MLPVEHGNREQCMRREDRRAAEREGRRTTARRAKAGALTAASLALVPLLGGGGVPVALQSTVDVPATVDADGQVPRQPSLSPDVLAAAGDPALLVQQLPSFADVPLSTMGTPVTGALGIPESALRAYQRAEQELAKLAPGCHIGWSLLAAIGRIESNHARGGRVDGRGTTVTPILGPILDGAGFAAVPDTDGGQYDGDTRWDRAVGPMQFIPATWRKYASDGNGDGVADPDNVFDAALAAGKYLCAGGGDLRDPQQRAQAVFRYNHSDAYVSQVLLWADAYERGASSVPDGQLPHGPGGRVGGTARGSGGRGAARAGGGRHAAARRTGHLDHAAALVGERHPDLDHEQPRRDVHDDEDVHHQHDHHHDDDTHVGQRHADQRAAHVCDAVVHNGHPDHDGQPHQHDERGTVHSGHARLLRAGYGAPRDSHCSVKRWCSRCPRSVSRWCSTPNVNAPGSPTRPRSTSRATTESWCSPRVPASAFTSCRHLRTRLPTTGSTASAA